MDFGPREMNAFWDDDLDLEDTAAGGYWRYSLGYGCSDGAFVNGFVSLDGAGNIRDCVYFCCAGQ